MPTITWEDFAKVELRVGRVVRAEPFPAARKPAYVLYVDFGDTLRSPGTVRPAARLHLR